MAANEEMLNGFDEHKNYSSLRRNTQKDDQVISTYRHTLSSTEEIYSQLEENEIYIDKDNLTDNMDNLYIDILLQILNNCEDFASQEISSENLLNLLRNSFKFSREKHDQLLKIAKSRKAPTILLNVGIIKVKDLLLTESKADADHFVTLHLQSDVLNTYHTSAKSITPITFWEEFFSFPLRNEPKKEILVVEVCRLATAQTSYQETGGSIKNLTVLGDLKSKFKKLKRTPSKAVKIIGRTEVPLKSISGSGIKVWYTFKKGLRKTQNRGSILLHLSISMDKLSQIVEQDHQFILTRIISYEQEKSNSYLWNGKLSAEAEALITQHYIRNGLSEIESDFMKWIAYTCVHEKNNISFSLLNIYLLKVIRLMPSLNDEGVQRFWDSVKKVIPSCFETIRKLRDDFFVEKQGIAMLIEVLNILKEIELLGVPSDVELLPRLYYGFRNKNEQETSIKSIAEMLNETIRSCTIEWLVTIKESAEMETNDSVQKTKNIIQKICFDLKRAINYHHNHFHRIMHIEYASIIYESYDNILLEYCKPAVIVACKNLPPFRVIDPNQLSTNRDSTTKMYMHLFEIYLSVKSLISLGSNLTKQEEVSQWQGYYHEWFLPAVPFWVETAIENALFAIEKAIDLDKFNPINENVSHSSSLLDTLSMLYQIKVFWEQLDWPSGEVKFILFGNILDGVGRCCTYYATKITTKISKFNTKRANETYSEISKEWCVAMCNIYEIKLKLAIFIIDLGVEKINETIKTTLCPDEAERCAKTIKNLIVDSQDTLHNELQNVIALTVDEIIYIMEIILLVNIDSLVDGISSLEDLFVFLDKNLSILHAELEEPVFEIMIENLHHKLLIVLHKAIESNLETYRPPSFFVNFRKVVNILTECLKADQKLISEISSNTSTQNLLELHSSTTETLIHNHYKEILQMQKDISTSFYGQLTIQAIFSNKNILNITVLNGKNILPVLSKKYTSTYVKIHYIPFDKFNQVPKQKTAVKLKTTYPLYDETFKIYLTSLQLEKDNVVVFTVKAKDLFKTSNKYLSECCLSFEDIRKSDGKQIHLNLFRRDCTIFKSNIFRVLEYRQYDDKIANSFVKKIRERSVSENNPYK